MHFTTNIICISIYTNIIYLSNCLYSYYIVLIIVNNKVNGYRLMVDRSSSKRCVPIRIRLAVCTLYYFFIYTSNHMDDYSVENNYSQRSKNC